MSNGFAHIELNTDDTAKAQKFYKAVFPSWKFQPVPGVNYAMIDTGDRGGAGGGLIKLPPVAEAKTLWLPYVTVDDVKKTVEKARNAGARIMLEFHDMGAMGTAGVFMDPSGASIGVWAKSKKAAPKKAAPKKAAPKKAAPKKAAPKKAAPKKAAPKKAKKR